MPSKISKMRIAVFDPCQTCIYMGVDFLDFLRSGEKDIHAFAESRRRRKRPSATSPPPGVPADTVLKGVASRDTRAGE